MHLLWCCTQFIAIHHLLLKNAGPLITKVQCTWSFSTIWWPQDSNKKLQFSMSRLIGTLPDIPFTEKYVPSNIQFYWKYQLKIVYTLSSTRYTSVCNSLGPVQTDTTNCRPSLGMQGRVVMMTSSYQRVLLHRLNTWWSVILISRYELRVYVIICCFHVASQVLIAW